MGKSSRKRLLPKPGAKTAGAALVAGLLLQDALDRLGGKLGVLAFGTQEHLFSDGSATYRLLWDVYQQVMPTFTLLVGAAVVAVPLVVVARIFARARVRAGKADPLGRVRAFASKRKWLPFVPATIAAALMTAVTVLDGVYFGSVWEGFMRALPG